GGGHVAGAVSTAGDEPSVAAVGAGVCSAAVFHSRRRVHAGEDERDRMVVPAVEVRRARWERPGDGGGSRVVVEFEAGLARLPRGIDERPVNARVGRIGSGVGGGRRRTARLTRCGARVALAGERDGDWMVVPTI